MRNFGFSQGGGGYKFDFYEAVREVETIVAETLGTDIHRYSVGVMDKEEHRESALRILSKRACPVLSMREIEKDIKNKNVSTYFTGDLDNADDYVILFPNSELIKPAIIAHALAYGEHFYEHSKSGGEPSFAAYWEKFHALSPAFVPALMMNKVEEETDKFTGHVPLAEGCDLSDYSSTIAWAPHALARSFTSIVEDVPFQELFHAPDEVAMWDIISDRMEKLNWKCWGLKVEGDYSEAHVRNMSKVLAMSRAKPVTIRIRGPDGHDADLVYEGG